MAALVGLVVGALAGHWLWSEWGAILGGLGGFFAGALLTGQRARAAFRKPKTAPAVAAPKRSAEEADRLAALETRVALLEARMGWGAAADRGTDPVAGIAAGEGSLPTSTLPVSLAGSAEGETPVPVDAAAPTWVPAHRPAADDAVAPGVDSTARSSGQAPRNASTLPPSVSALGIASMARSSAATLNLASTAPSSVPASASPANPIWAWFTGGNAMTRIGVVVFFFGVAFLLRYFAEHFTIPIAMRLAGIAVVGVAFVGLGERVARSRPAYGRSLQGAGMGILYLTAFAAYRPFAVLPAAVVLVLLALAAALTVWLALRANAEVLAALAVAGAFLAPMLTGADRTPLTLFGYFTVINGAVLAIATRRTWRSVSVLGFVFTFLLAFWWGYRFYRPVHFAIAEPFLLLHLAIYVAVAVLHARRPATPMGKPLDGMLVFGVPVVAFALQLGLVTDMRYGAAVSALGFGIGYATLSIALRRADAPDLTSLGRLFTGLAVVFASLAVPYAFDAPVTAALWAVEGALVFWLGVTQRAAWVRVFAILLQLAAGGLFLLHADGDAGNRLLLNPFFMGASMLALAGFATTWLADRALHLLREAERAALPLAYGWSAMWWLGAGAAELTRHLPRAWEAHALLAFVVVTVLAALVVRRVLAWPRALAIAVALPAAMLLVGAHDLHRVHTMLLQEGWLLWPLAWVMLLASLRALEPRSSDTAGAAPAWLGNAHAIVAVALTAQLAWEASEWTGRVTADHTVWLACAAALPAIGYLALVPRCRALSTWPFARYADAYAVRGAMPIAVFVVLWVIGVNVLSPGDPYPLPYAPLANPLDVLVASALLVLFRWSGMVASLAERQRFGMLGLGIFLSINGGILRAGHHWGDIAWDLPALLASRPLQASLTLAWTLTGVGLMIAAGTHALRPLWMVGAAMLALAVVKLFLVDLAALEGLPRVIAFLGAGGMLLLIGYVSPLPPARAASVAPSPADPSQPAVGC
ncbi:MAG: DUF2339 domain-containing protein [Casimicrobiaceae bacterium]